jgi:TM2 domain
MNHRETAYILWLAGFAGLGGLHRMYNGKMVSGVLWLCTGGMFGIGQVIDLFLIPGMVENHNLRKSHRLGVPYEPERPTLEKVVQLTQPATPPQSLNHRLLRCAQQHQGRLSLAQAVLETNAEFEQVESALKTLVKKGYAELENHPHSGVIVYFFPELAPPDPGFVNLPNA